MELKTKFKFYSIVFVDNWYIAKQVKATSDTPDASQSTGINDINDTRCLSVLHFSLRISRWFDKFLVNFCLNHVIVQKR